jgi:hypothetical protein
VYKCCYSDTVLRRQSFAFVAYGVGGVLDEHTQLSQLERSSHTGPPGYKGYTRFQPMLTGGPVRLLP